MMGPDFADPDGPAEPDPGPAHDARDVRPPVEQRGQVPGRVGDLAGQHRVLFHGPDLDRADPALDGGPPGRLDRADRLDPGGGRGPFVAGLARCGRVRCGFAAALAEPAARQQTAHGRGRRGRGGRLAVLPPGLARAGGHGSRGVVRRRGPAIARRGRRPCYGGLPVRNCLSVQGGLAARRRSRDLAVRPVAPGAQHLQAVPHVEGHDRGRAMRDAAHHGRDLVGGTVVQQPAEQR